MAHPNYRTPVCSWVCVYELMSELVGSFAYDFKILDKTEIIHSLVIQIRDDSVWEIISYPVASLDYMD